MPESRLARTRAAYVVEHESVNVEQLMYQQLYSALLEVFDPRMWFRRR